MSEAQTAKCLTCRTTRFCLDTDVLPNCAKCGEPLTREPAPYEDRFDWPKLWDRAQSAMSARRDGHESSVGMPAEAVLYLMKRAAVAYKGPYEGKK